VKVKLNQEIQTPARKTWIELVEIKRWRVGEAFPEKEIKNENKKNGYFRSRGISSSLDTASNR